MRILVTGGAGFIGSHLVERLLDDKRVKAVRVLDDLSTGRLNNLEGFSNHPKLEWVEGDIRNYETCLNACENIDIISHHAALGSVPRSVADPLTTNEVNSTGTLHIFEAARQKKLGRIVYAASSSTYGDHKGLPKIEDRIGNPLSPYAVTKYVNELYARVYSQLYGLEIIGLRYFNIFGPRQNPQGPYAAVIPLFADAIIKGQPPTIHGDGHHSRDFTYVDNAIDANMQALFTENREAIGQVYNIACGKQTSLTELFNILKTEAGSNLQPIHGPERPGDVEHSLADISKAGRLLGYAPAVSVEDGLKRTFNWYKASNH